MLSGPSGAGKDALLARLRERGYTFVRPVTMTTRAPRVGEIDGVHYVFASGKQFAAAERDGDLLEHAEVHGRRYGLPREQLRRALDEAERTGNDVLVQVDVQGAASLRPLLPDARFVFLAPGSFEELESRLRDRATENHDDARIRLETARRELVARDDFDDVVVNAEGALDDAVDALVALLERERARPDRRPVEL